MIFITTIILFVVFLLFIYIYNRVVKCKNCGKILFAHLINASPGGPDRCQTTVRRAVCKCGQKYGDILETGTVLGNVSHVGG